ncbi:hypothetical protein ACQPYK_11070 [Streptosporangium sp. CA-135522]|uniref:hypothetical protein n=1 Tax=Streptosporangium sp. CA-135522 TaxID=3240072 RepID=UPI003D8E57E1
MSAGDYEQRGGAKPAIETFGLRLRCGPAETRNGFMAVAGEFESGEAQGGRQRMVEVSA